MTDLLSPERKAEIRKEEYANYRRKHKLEATKAVIIVALAVFLAPVIALSIGVISGASLIWMMQSLSSLFGFSWGWLFPY